MSGTEEDRLITIGSCLLLPGYAGNNNHSMYYKVMVNGNYIGNNRGVS